jgi:hypothetical protein
VEKAGDAILHAGLVPLGAYQAQNQRQIGARRPITSATMARTMNSTNSTLAMLAAPAAMPPNPNSAAIREW